MTAINLALRGFPGFAIHSDSLKVDPVAAWKVMPSKGLMSAPIRECEPPQFMQASEDETADSSEETAASDSTDKSGRRNVQIDVDVEHTQQAEFAAFTDGDSGAGQ